MKLTSEVQQLIQRSHWEVITIEARKIIARKQRQVKTRRMTRIFVYLPFGHSRKCFFTDYFFTVLVDFGVPFSINFLFFRIFSLPKNSRTRRHLFGLVSFVDWKFLNMFEMWLSCIIISYVMFFPYANFQRSQKRHCYQLHWDTLFQKCFWSHLSNDPGKVDSNFFCYEATVLSPHRNVLIFTQGMHKPTWRPFTQ